MTKIEDAIFAKILSDTSSIYGFLSRNWNSLRPWTYYGNKVSYIDYKKYQSHLGYMHIAFIGPLSLIYYKLYE